ncbi:RNA helicase [Curvularia kusanoi]|uniref:RNA helicase n=1 Tax=Curvularia kusanoi TaxID=90978 RepID=A0A9P4TF14_CURKU|nr:RNA helicase [Curvularia kusanoi]
MSALPTRRNSLCLFCTFAARSSQPPRLLPRTQVAYRSVSVSVSKSGGKRFQGSNQRKHRGSFNPLISSRHGNDRPLNDDTVRSIVDGKLEKLQAEFTKPEFLASLDLSLEKFGHEWKRFKHAISAWVKQDSRELIELVQLSARHKSNARLETRLRYLFYAQTCGGRFTTAELDNQKQVADLRYPAEWYPATREVPRVVHMHVGPTNSGKTYHALKRLEAAKSGIYLGPLRLLAHEVFTRLNAKGRSCALVTGEEQRVPEGNGPPPMYSCTVEMAPLNTRFDVAVIDEIQMINHPERGWAWTQAFLGLQAREIHLCGEARTVNIMRELCALVGDEVHVHTYERLTPLAVESQSLRGDLSKLQKGDCLVAFTVVGIHALRREIEKRTGKKCAIVYGSLPPETRAQQAKLFNDPDNDYDFLVASDAIGMGLNLAIKRVIFESTMKSNGSTLVPLQISDIKQIAGRAGRYKTAADAVTDSAQTGQAVVKKEKTIGWCTTLDQADLAALKDGMSREPEPIETAGLFPPSLIIERFANYFPPGTPFSYILLRLHEISVTHSRFHLCGLKEQLAIADVIHTVKGLSTQDRIMITSAPCNTRDKDEKTFLRTLAECIATGQEANLLELPNIPLDVMDEPPRGDREYLYSLERLHKMVILYLWLSYRFPNIFTTRSLANYTKKLLEDQIESVLTQFSTTELRLQQKAQRQRARAAEQEAKKAQKATQQPKKSIPAPPGLPEEAKDIVNDERAFADGPPSTDDVDEYPEDPIEESEKSEESAENVKTEGSEETEQTEKWNTITGKAQAEQQRSANL